MLEMLKFYCWENDMLKSSVGIPISLGIMTWRRCKTNMISWSPPSDPQKKTDEFSVALQIH